MIVIYAEKASLGLQIAAALDKITLHSSKEVHFPEIGKYQKEIQKQQSEDGYLDITYNGKECKVIWGQGHICALKREKDYNPEYALWSKLPVPFFPPMEIKINDAGNEWSQKACQRSVSIAKKYFAKAEYIINATDDDREGELIFAYLYQYLECKKPVKRVLLSSYSKKGITDAFANTVDYSTRENVIAAGRARSYSDFYVGTNITAALTLKNPHSGVLSCGRLQTTILNIIVEREKAITGFKPQDYYTIESLFSVGSENFKGIHKQDRFAEKSKAEDILKKLDGAKTGTVIEVTSEVQKKAAPELYSLSALQIDAGSAFGYTLKKVQDIAQKLYDEGYTTYPRTNSRYLNEDRKEDLLKVICALEKANPAYAAILAGIPKVYNHPENYFNDKKVTSHFAIIPTGKMPKGLSVEEANVYDLIAKSIIRTVLPDAEVSHTKVNIDVKGEEFCASGTSVVKRGWMAAGSVTKEKFIPLMKKGDTLSIEKIEILDKKTKPPKRFTDASLVRALIGIGKELDDKDLRAALSNPEHTGIGTDATRAPTVETLVKREYIKRDKGGIISPTEKGTALIEFLPIEELKSPEMTARWEQRLANIQNGKGDTFDDFIRDVKADVVKWLDIINSGKSIDGLAKGKDDSVIGKCPFCGKDIRKYDWGYGCTGYKEGCKFSVSKKIGGKTITDANVKALISTGRSHLIKGFVSAKTKKKYDAYIVLEGGRVRFPVFPE